MIGCVRTLTLSGALAAVLIAVALGGCGSSAPAAPPSPGTVQGNGLQGLILKPQQAAPPLALRNYTGQPVSLASMRGKAVFVTFVYTHCPNACPLIVSNLAAAQRAMGKEASHVEMVAVTVDPRRDTPQAVRTFLTTRGALGRMYYLIGSRRQLLPIWKAWHVGITVDTKQTLVGHTAIVYGITAGGRMAVVYPSNFSPQQIVHDTPLLARQ
jgi:protein SCO1/2